MTSRSSESATTESHKSRLLKRIAQAKIGSNISEDFWREIEALADRIVVQDIDGRTIKFDKVAEAEAALAEVEGAYERLVADLLAACANTCPPSGIGDPNSPVRFWHQQGCDGECLSRFQVAVANAIEGKS